MIEEQQPIRLSEQVVAQKVAEYLKNCHPEGVSLEVDPDGVRWEGFWWRVRVRPSEEPSKLSPYYEALADVETALEEKEHLKVFLAPSPPKQPDIADTEATPSRSDGRPIRRPRWTKKTVVHTVTEYLRECHPGGITPRADENRVQRVNDSWRVAVQPDVELPNPLEYYEALTGVEMALDE